jgi:hypothetical protein
MVVAAAIAAAASAPEERSDADEADQLDPDSEGHLAVLFSVSGSRLEA